jgi:hypothetical protein
MANNNPTNIPAANALDLHLIGYAYGAEVLPAGFLLVKPINEPGPNQTLEIDIVKNVLTGHYYVVPRGTANLQNAATDLQLANDPLLTKAIQDAANYMQANIDPNASIEFVGHSLGEVPAVMLAEKWAEFAGNQNISVHTYDGAGIPSANVTAQMTANLESVTTNYRLVLPGAQPTLSNGMTAGDIVSTLNNHFGTVVEVPATPGTFSSLIDLHSSGDPLFQADWSSARTISRNGIAGIGLDALENSMASIAQVFDVSQGQLGGAGQIANVTTVLGRELVRLGVAVSNGANRDEVAAWNNFAAALRTTSDALSAQIPSDPTDPIGTAIRQLTKSIIDGLPDPSNTGSVSLINSGTILTLFSAGAKTFQDAETLWQTTQQALATGISLEKAMLSAAWKVFQGVDQSCF